jgi:hypothetical protein
VRPWLNLTGELPFGDFMAVNYCLVRSGMFAFWSQFQASLQNPAGY